MLYVLVFLAVSYLLYTYGVKFQTRGHLLGKGWLDRCGYACLMTAAMAVTLPTVLLTVELLDLHISGYGLSLISTLGTVALGEFLYARTAKVSVRMLALLRAEERKREA